MTSPLFTDADYEAIWKYGEKACKDAFYASVRSRSHQGLGVKFNVGKKLVAFEAECARNYDPTDCSRSERLRGA